MALEHVLKASDGFSKRFKVRTFPPVHEITREKVVKLHASLGQCDLVIAQRVSESYRGLGVGTKTLASMAPKATLVRWPDAYWGGYFPDLFYLRDAAGQSVVNGPFDYHDRGILHAFVSGWGVDETIQRLRDPDQPLTAEEWVRDARENLQIREHECDIAISPFVESAFDSALLFFTMNHPANIVLKYMAEQVLELIGLPNELPARKRLPERLCATFYPIHANHHRALGLQFVTPDTYKIRGASYDPRRAVKAFFSYYKAHPELVSLNALGSTRTPEVTESARTRDDQRDAISAIGGTDPRN
jgi:hypothetical protein